MQSTSATSAKVWCSRSWKTSRSFSDLQQLLVAQGMVDLEMVYMLLAATKKGPE